MFAFLFVEQGIRDRKVYFKELAHTVVGPLSLKSTGQARSLKILARDSISVVVLSLTVLSQG